MPVEHYENFPVASLLLPARLRPAVEAIYRFARTADDLADEGDAEAGERLEALSRFRSGLDRIASKLPPEDRLFADLQAAIQMHGLTLAPFYDLLSAFEQDVVTSRYASHIDVLDYCSRSANPVGRLMLELYGMREERYLLQSDAICSALQLINFIQDVAIDARKGRIYLPLQDLQQFEVSETSILAGEVTPAFRALLKFEVDRARALMRLGAALPLALPGRIGLELRLVVQGGLRILEKIEAVQFDVIHQRPTLKTLDWPRLMLRAACMRPSPVAASSRTDHVS